MKKKLEFHHCILIIVGILVLDQLLKVYIKLNFPLTIYSDQIIFDYNWFKLLFVENKGMAWGASINDFLPFIDSDLQQSCEGPSSFRKDHKKT